MSRKDLRALVFLLARSRHTRDVVLLWGAARLYDPLWWAFLPKVTCHPSEWETRNFSGSDGTTVTRPL